MSSDIIEQHWPGLNESETPADTEHLQEERKEKEGEEMGRDCKEIERGMNVREREELSKSQDEKESKGEEREIESRCDQMWENGESELKEKEREFEDVEFGERRETESRKENIVVREEVEEDGEKTVRSIHEDVKGRGSEDVSGVKCSIQVLDGHIALGSVQWEQCRAKAAGRVQV